MTFPDPEITELVLDLVPMNDVSWINLYTPVSVLNMAGTESSGAIKSLFADKR